MSSEYQLDQGLLTITDSAVISGSPRTEDEMLESAQKGVKYLLSELITLPVTVKKGKFEGTQSLLQLPQPVMKLPREKAPPKPKPLTAWEKFALKKGIDLNKKKTNKVFDEERQIWKDKWGKRAREYREKHDWLREVKPGYVATEKGGDPFLDERREKKGRLDHQKKLEDHNKRRAANIAKAQQEVSHLMHATAHLNTASRGKFDKKTKP